MPSNLILASERAGLAVLKGAVAGVLATVGMSAVMAATHKVGVLGEPPPRKLMRKTLHSLGVWPRKRALDAATVAGHLGYGAAMGALFALLPRTPQRDGTRGALFGLAVYVASYAGWLPAVGLMPKPSRDRPGRQPSMIAAHVAYGNLLGRLLPA